MAGKSNKNKTKSRSATAPQPALGDDSESKVSENSQVQEEEASQSSPTSNSNDEGDNNVTVSTEEDMTTSAIPNTDESSLPNGHIADPTSAQPQAEGELQLYPIAVKGPSGERIELQVNPGDSVMDLRQFLLDASETCFYTCYDLILVTADSTRFQLADYNEIGEVADVTVGGCELEMVNALYDERSVRTHLKRTRELLSMISIHSSLSTALALEHEAKQQKDAGLKKTDAPELEGLGFMEDSTGLIENLVPSSIANDIRCVDSIAFSSFNPVPGYRRLLGDLIYLDIATCEGGRYCVTGHTRGFYVNMTTHDVFDYRSSSPPREASTLVGLLRQLSEKFTKGFLEVLERKSQGHPFENVPSLLPLNPWLGCFPPPPHRRDIARAEDALVLPFGIEMVGMQRDWNEELQSCREFPRKNLQDRIIRDRALYKVNCDFVDAAIKGAKGVIGRCIPPINPTDPERFHMYVHNNIFFSFAIDGDLNLMQQMNDSGSKGNDQESKKADEVSCDAKPDSDTREILANDEANIEQQKSNEGSDNLSKPSETSIVVDMEARGTSTLSQVIESEQATYASANNDLKGTKAYNNADVSGLCTLGMTIVDYRGHRIVAQSIIPGILQGDKSESLLYGSVDNGKKISWNEKFHLKMLEAGKLLHIKEHEVYDASGNAMKMAAPVDCKGIVGSDDRQYLLDLMRITPRDANFMGPGSRHCVLRPELVAAFCQVEASERAKQKEVDIDGAMENGVEQEELPAILLNPNVLTECKLAGNSEEIVGDEQLVKQAGKYLVDVVLPKFIEDMNSLEVSPMDGQTLTEALHAHGINVRYLGQVANLAKHLPHIWDLCVKEMAVRAAKHVLKGVLRETQDHDVAGAIAHFLNCFFGKDALAYSEITQPAEEKTAAKVVKPEKSRKKTKAQKKSQNSANSQTSNKHAKAENGFARNENSKKENRPSYTCITSNLVWTDINAFVKFKYEFELPADIRASIQRISVLRNLCLKVGIIIAARTYDFSAAVPFQISDILDLHSVTKHSAPMCADARELLETGKLRLAQGKLNEAYETFSEAFTILQQVCGPMHREVANCCRYLAMALYHAGDMAGAIMQQHKELIINERCLGLDHPDTAHSYGNMALFYHGLNQTELALRHMGRTLLLLNVSCGSDHPDVAATFINVAMMYQDIGRMNVALRYLQEALKKNKGLLGEDHIQTAVCYHALAIAFNCMGAFKLSMQHEKSTHTILVKQLGEDDARTRDSANWLKTFQARDQQAQKQKGQAISVAAAAEALRARPDLLQAFQAAAVAGSGSRVGGLNNAANLMPDTVPRNRGLDKRGARAVAEVRKKAAAKGLNIKPQGAVPPEAVPPPLNELLSLFENGLGKVSNKKTNTSSSSSLSSLQASGKDEVEKKVKTVVTVEKTAPEVKEEIQSKDSDNGADNQSEMTNPKTGGNPAPLGLGLGLTDVKKLKQKANTSLLQQSNS